MLRKQDVLSRENVGQRYTVELASYDFRKVQVCSMSLGFVKECYFVELDISQQPQIITTSQVLSVREGW